MEIVYMWIEKFNNCLEHQEYSFGGKYKISYDNKKKKLFINDNANFIENFYGNNISNVTAIIGGNGTGKTSTLDIILRNLTKNIENIQTQGIFIIKSKSQENDVLTIFIHQELGSIEIKNNSTVTKEVFEYTAQRDLYYKAKFSNNYSNVDRNTSFIYLSHSEDDNLIRRNFAYNNLTINQYIKNIDTSTYMVTKAMLKMLEIRDMIQYVNFAKDNKLETEKFEVPNIIEINSISIDNLENIFKLYDFEQKEIDKIRKTNHNMNKKNGKFHYRFLLGLGLYLVMKLDLPKQRFIANANRVDELTSFVRENAKDLFKNERAKLDIFQNTISCIERLKNQSVESGSNGAITIELNDNNRKLLDDLIINLCNQQLDFELISIKWYQLSTGQRAFLNLFSKIYSLDEVRANVILLIDEGEVFLHPNWQREYINLLLKTIPKILEHKICGIKKNLSIQVVLTSNTPFVLSDLLGENVVFLGENEFVGNTFGSNIHSLLKNEFFMNQTMGEFAKNRIEDIVRKLNSNFETDELEENELVKIKKVIDQCGEPIIRNKLINLFNNRKMNNLEILLKSELSGLITERELLKSYNPSLSNTVSVIERRIFEINSLLGNK